MGAKPATTGPMAAGARSAVLFISPRSGLAKKKPDVSSTKRSPTTPAAVEPPKMKAARPSTEAAMAACVVGGGLEPVVEDCAAVGCIHELYAGK